MAETWRLWRRIETTHNGRLLVGSYSLANGMVYVRALDREKVAQIGGSTPESIARMMLGEIPRDIQAERFAQK
jgi:hypothetical protein